MFINEFVDFLFNLCVVLFVRNVLYLINVIYVYCYKRVEVKINFFKIDKCYSYL